MTPVTSTLSATEEFTSNFWWNFSHYLTGTDPRYLDSFSNRRIYVKFLVEFLPLFDRDWPPVPRLFQQQKNLRQIFGGISPTIWPGLTPDISTDIYFHQEKNLRHFFGRISFSIWLEVIPFPRQFHKQKNFRQIFSGVSSTVWTEPIPDTSMVEPYPCH